MVSKNILMLILPGKNEVSLVVPLSGWEQYEQMNFISKIDKMEMIST